MRKACSDDLRSRIVHAVEAEGLSQPAVAARFSVLRAAGGHIRVPAADIRTVRDIPRIERMEDPATGAVTFQLRI